MQMISDMKECPGLWQWDKDQGMFVAQSSAAWKCNCREQWPGLWKFYKENRVGIDEAMEEWKCNCHSIIDKGDDSGQMSVRVVLRSMEFMTYKLQVLCHLWSKRERYEHIFSTSGDRHDFIIWIRSLYKDISERVDLLRQRTFVAKEEEWSSHLSEIERKMDTMCGYQLELWRVCKNYIVHVHDIGKYLKKIESLIIISSCHLTEEEKRLSLLSIKSKLVDMSRIFDIWLIEWKGDKRWFTSVVENIRQVKQIDDWFVRVLEFFDMIQEKKLNGKIVDSDGEIINTVNFMRSKVGRLRFFLEQARALFMGRRKRNGAGEK